MSAVNAAIVALEVAFNCHEGIPTHLSQTGERYEELTLSLGYRGGESTDEALAEEWLLKVLEYAKGRGTHLYWRRKPEIVEQKRHPHIRSIYGRLLVTDKGPSDIQGAEDTQNPPVAF